MPRRPHDASAPIPLRTLTVLTTLCALACACGDDGDATSDTDAADVADTDDTADTADTSLPYTDAPDAPDTTDANDASDGVPAEAVACDDGHACNTDLLPDGRCPGACLRVSAPLTCRGTVALGVCRPAGWQTRPTEPSADFGDYTVRAVDVPTAMIVGDTHALTLAVDNDTAAPLTVPFSVRSPGNWELTGASWSGLTELELPAGGSLTLSAILTAVTATTLADGVAPIASFTFGGVDLFEPRSVIHFAPGADTITCGGAAFPEVYCAGDDCFGSRAFYNQARCCGDVFFPSAGCCEDADCADHALGACIDGLCVARAPAFPGASALPTGRHRVLLALVDTHPEWAGTPCADRADPLAGDLGLATVGELYDAMATARFGRPTLEIQWVVRAGIDSADFLAPGAPVYWDAARDGLDDWFATQGCDGLDAFDEVIISLPTLDLGPYGGRYFGDGGIGVLSPTSPLLLAHELGHAFGGDDLYLELGGTFQWADALMGNNQSSPPLPGDHVLWGQAGFADLDGDGVIDIARYATAPDSVYVVAPTARITTKDTLEIAFGVGALEDGVERAIHLERVRLVVPVAGFDTDVVDARERKLLVFDHTQVDLDALRTAGTVEVGFYVRYAFTDAAWERQERTLETTMTLPITFD